MTAFGDELRSLRLRHGLTQQALSRALGNSLSRSTIAGIESGHQTPSADLPRLLAAKFPRDWPKMEGAYFRARRMQEAERGRRQAARAAQQPVPDQTSLVLGGHYVIEELDLIYNFRESRAPEEIVELRRVRALRSGAHDFRLTLLQEDSTGFVIEPEVLFGGRLSENERRSIKGETLYTQRVEFDGPLRRGNTHTFGLRYWVQRDPNPGDYITVEMTNPTGRVAVHVNFWGKQQPRRTWRFGPMVEALTAPEQPTDATSLPLLAGRGTAVFVKPELGTYFGLAWAW